MKKILAVVILAVIICSLYQGSAQASYDPNNLASDRAFINTSTLSTAGIQNFLAARRSFLRSYSQGGRTAAQIIRSAASTNGMNPIAILATLQKETGIVYGTHAGSLDQWRLDRAMGYACYSGVSGDYNGNGCRDSNEGFTNQVNYGTWQLRRNYDYWAANGSEWNVGRTMNIDGTNVTFRSRATSALYRYTPHLGGNYTFNYYFSRWGGEGVYDAQYVTQGPRTGIGIPWVALLPGQRFAVWVNYRNTGTTTWYKTGLNPVHLGTAAPRDRGSSFMRGRNLRGYMTQSRVAPGQIGTFVLYFTAPSSEGTYVEHFQLVAENIRWFAPEVSWTYTVSKGLAAKQTNVRYIGQGPVRGPGASGMPLDKGQVITLWVRFVNTGAEPWLRGGTNAVHLGTNMPQNRNSIFLGNSHRRGYLRETTVLPGQVGTFQINIVAPSRAGSYIEHFRPVMEDVTWFGPDISWPLTVR